MDVNVSLEDNDIWLTSSQLCTLFGKTKSTISKHIKNILESDNPICEKARPTVAKKETVQIEGGKTVTRNIDYYNLNLIIAIGHKVNSIRGEKLKKLLEQYLNEKYQDNSNIIIYNNGSLSLPVTISPEEDTVYLNQNQIAELFDTTQPNIAMHIKNIVEEGELTLEATHKYFLLVQNEGGRSIRRSVDYYNLDMILSIGYRVRSKTAIGFRRWTANILKGYMLKKYCLDANRLIVVLENNFNKNTNIMAY